MPMLSGDWREMNEVFGGGDFQRHRMPLPEYAMTKEFDICLRKDVSPNAMEYLFTEGPAATFWYKVPTGMISRIVETFLQRSTKAALRPIFCVCDYSTPGPTLLWQELYVDFFPCVRCQRGDFLLSAEEQYPGREHPVNFHVPSLPEHIWRLRDTVEWYESLQKHSRHIPNYFFEVIHVKNPTTGQAMTIELWFCSITQDIVERGGPFPGSTRAETRELCHVKIYARDCKNPAPMPLVGPLRRGQLLAELMLEAYRFLDRHSLDVSQLVCDEWRSSVERSSEQLALYPLSAEFKHFDSERVHVGMNLDHEWEATFVNYSNCFGEVNRREFDFLKSQPPEHSSAVIRRHMRNAFVKRMSCDVMTRDFDWNVGMLLGLGGNTLIGKLNVLFMHEECLTLLGRFEEALILRKVRKLCLIILDPLLNTLVAHHNFFGRPAIQQLKRLELRIRHLDASLEPYWLPALYELSGCRRLRIRYLPEEFTQHTLSVDMTRISSALRAMLEDFETNGRDIAVRHFWLTSFVRIPSFVGARKPVCEGIPVPSISTIDSQRWNAYCYETANDNRCLTLFVQPEDAARVPTAQTDIHVQRGRVTVVS